MRFLNALARLKCCFSAKIVRLGGRPIHVYLLRRNLLGRWKTFHKVIN